MRHIYTLLLVAATLQFGFSQIKFDPTIDIDFTTEEVLVPASPLETQILFVGGTDMVQTTATYGNPAGEVPAKEWHDFIGFVEDNDSDDLGWVIVNHEMIQANDNIGDGGGMTMFKVKRDEDNDSLIIIDQTLADGRSGKFFNVDFANTVGETGMNCGGITSPSGRVWTAEEWFRTSNANINYDNAGVRDTAEYTISSDIAVADGQKVEKYQNFNYMVEIDYKEAKAIRKQYNWGRNGYEGGAILADDKTVYLGHDGTPGYMVKFVADVAGDFTEGHTYAYKEPSEKVQLSHFSTIDGVYPEISAYDQTTQNIYSTNSETGEVSVIDVTDPRELKVTGTINVSEFGTEITSVSANNGRVAIAVPNENTVLPGRVVIVNTDNINEAKDYPTGSLPDMVTFTPDGKYVLTANEGEPNDDYTIDPNGSITVVNVETEEVTQITFEDLTAADVEGVRIFGNGTTNIAADLEPEYIAVTDDSKKAVVTLQENNAIAIIDLETLTLAGIKALGYKDHSVVALDPSNKDDSIAYLRTYDNLYGMYQPDAVEIVNIDGVDYILTANEGDARDYDGYSEEARVKDLELDPVAFSNAAELQEDANLGRLKCTTSQGDTDGDGDFDEIYCYGGRSFTIWDFDGNIVFDSGTDFATNVATIAPQNYADSRDDDKGSEPESIITATIGDRVFAFIGLERAGGVMVYDITVPTDATFVDYYNKDGVDLSPEGLAVISADASTDGANYLVSTNESFGDYTGTVSLYRINGFEDTRWVEINNKDFDKMLNFVQEATESGATMFNRLEWVWADAGTNAVYFTETGRDNPAGKWAGEYADGGQLAAHHVARAEAQGTDALSDEYWDYYGRVIKLDLDTDEVSVYLSGGPYFEADSVSSAEYPAIHLSNPDGLSGININGQQYMIVQEDLNGTSHGRIPLDITSNRTCEMYLLDMSIAEPTVEDLVRISVVPQGAEITGGVGTPDGKTILVNAQHPSSDNPFPYNHSMTYAITGWDKTDVSVEPVVKGNDFGVYPNPVSRMLFLNKVQDVAIYDAHGNRVRVLRGIDRVNVSTLTPGVYYIVNGEGETKKVNIQK